MGRPPDNWRAILERETFERVICTEMPPADSILHVSAIDFYSAAGQLAICGRAVDVHPKEERFYIELNEAILLEWWNKIRQEGTEPEVITPVDLIPSWNNEGLSGIVTGPRQLVFHRWKDDDEQLFHPRAGLQALAALELIALTDEKQRVLIRASQNYPTDLEILFKAQSVSEGIRGLLPFGQG